MPCSSTPGRARRRSCAEPGFTLVEALVALVIVGLAVVFAIEALAAGLRGQIRARHHLEAVALADARMNQLALLPADSLDRYRDVRTGHFAAPFERYRWRALVRPAGGSPSLFQAAVLVAWDGGEFALETFLYRPSELPRAVRGGP